MKIRDEMTTGIITVGIGAPLMDAIDIMAKNKVSAVVAIYPNGAAAGVISTSDTVEVILKKSREAIKKMTVEDAMSDIISIEPEKTLKDALKLMVKDHIHRVFVLSSSQAGGRPIGVISATDIVRKLQKEPLARHL